MGAGRERVRAGKRVQADTGNRRAVAGSQGGRRIWVGGGRGPGTDHACTPTPNFPLPARTIGECTGTSAGGEDERGRGLHRLPSRYYQHTCMYCRRAVPGPPGQRSSGRLLEMELGVAGGSVSLGGGGPTGDLIIPKRSWRWSLLRRSTSVLFSKRNVSGR